uniref:Uncharacterized protein n=1 Tax=Glossina brevipalpis TaxID=37001 RepID=A0A1A9WBS6_9MUSC
MPETFKQSQSIWDTFRSFTTLLNIIVGCFTAFTQMLASWTTCQSSECWMESDLSSSAKSIKVVTVDILFKALSSERTYKVNEMKLNTCPLTILQSSSSDSTQNL